MRSYRATIAKVLVIAGLLTVLFCSAALAEATIDVWGADRPRFPADDFTFLYAGSYVCNTVASNACHAYCIRKHYNSTWVYDPILHYNEPHWAEVGWIWDKSMSKPLWFVDINSGTGEIYYQFTEQITPGTNHTLKCQRVIGSSVSQWRFYRDGGEICRLNSVHVDYGFSLVSAQKSNIYETNTSFFWGARHYCKGYFSKDQYWYDWYNNDIYRDTDPYYFYRYLSRTSANVQPGKDPY